MTHISTTEARGKIGAAVRALAKGPVLLTTRDDVVAVLLHPAEYDRLRQIEGAANALNVRPAVAS